jgi:hypothetical protein
MRITGSKAPEGQNIGNKQSEKSISAPEGRNIVSYSQKTPLLRPSGAKNTEGGFYVTNITPLWGF